MKFIHKYVLKVLLIFCVIFYNQTSLAEDLLPPESKSNPNLFELSLEELGEITIATKTSRSSSEIPSTVFVYSQEDIRRHSWNSLAELVQDIPGVDVINKGGRGITLSVRGVGDLNFHGAKTVVMIDGHNTAFSALGSPSFSGFMDQYDILSAKRVEIQIGPGGTLHGANAFGIVINIISMAPEDIDGVETDLVFGSQGEVIPSIRYGSRDGAWGVFQSFTSWNQSDSNLSEVAISKNSDDSEVIYNNNTYEAQTSNNIDLHGYVDYDHKFRLGYRYSRVSSGRGTSLLSQKKGKVIIEQPMIYLDFKTGISDRISYNLISHYKESKNSSSESYFVDTVRNIVGVTSSESTSLVIDNQFTFFQSSQVTWVSGIYYERSRLRPSAVSLAFGTTNPDDRAEPKLNDERNFDNYAGYLQLEWIPDDRFYLVTGLRYVETESKYPSEVIPRLGMRYVLSEKWLTKFNYQKGYRPPSVGEGLERGVVKGNPDIASEIIDSYELSLVGNPWKKLGMRATYFESDITNLISRVPYSGGGGFVSIDDNINKIKIKGFELELNSEINDKFKVESTATYTDSLNEANNQKTRTVVPYKLNLSFISQFAPQWYLVWANYFRWKPTTDTSNALYEGKDAKDWLLSNLTITNDYAFDIKGLNLSLSIRNLFNQEYGNVDPRATTNPGTPFITSYHPQEKINFLFGVNYVFQ